MCEPLNWINDNLELASTKCDGWDSLEGRNTVCRTDCDWTLPAGGYSCDLTETKALMGKKSVYKQYFGPDSEMKKCKAEVDISLPFVTDVDDVMEKIGSKKESVNKVHKVLQKLDKITEKLYPLLNAIPKVGRVSSIVQKIQSIVTIVVSILDKIVKGAKLIHQGLSRPAKIALGVVKSGIEVFDEKATKYFESMTKAYECKSQRCRVADELNEASRLGTLLFDDYGLGETFEDCATVLGHANDEPKELWDKIMGIFDVIIPGIDIISELVDKVMGIVDKLASDAIGLMNAAKCCLPGQIQQGASLLVKLFNLLMCPLHAVEISLMTKVKEVLADKMLELVELLVPDVKFNFAYASPSFSASIPDICGAEPVSVGFEFKLNFDFKAEMTAKFQEAMGDQTAVSSGTDVTDIGAAIKKSCSDAFADLTAPPPPTCDCQLMASLSKVAGNVAELSGDALQAAADAGPMMKDAANEFNSFAGSHLGEAWSAATDQWKDSDVRDQFSGALNAVGDTYNAITSIGE
jgi:hypothetical protein